MLLICLLLSQIKAIIKEIKPVDIIISNELLRQKIEKKRITLAKRIKQLRKPVKKKVTKRRKKSKK